MATSNVARIAFLSFDWDFEIVSKYYRGMQAYVDANPDVQVVIFSAFGHYYADPGHLVDPNTHQVFRLYDVDDFDGLILQGNRFWPPELRQQAADEAQSRGLPVISINYDLTGAHTVGTDNYDAMFRLVDKVLTDRRPRHPVFVNGLATSFEAQMRLKAYRDCCKLHGMEDAPFIQANWEIEEGVGVARKMLEDGSDLPDAIFCCNDDLAVGIQGTLQESGVQVGSTSSSPASTTATSARTRSRAS